MRKIIESTLVSVDGVIGDPMVWASDYFAGEAQDDALAQLMASCPRVKGGSVAMLEAERPRRTR
jgi:hypothetical protein